MIKGFIAGGLIVGGALFFASASSGTETPMKTPDLIGFRALHVSSPEQIHGEIKSGGVSINAPHSTGAKRAHEQVYWDANGQVVARLSIHQFSSSEQAQCLRFSKSSWAYLSRKDSLSFKPLSVDELQGKGDVVLKKIEKCGEGLVRFSLHLRGAPETVMHDWNRTPPGWES
jgi:hypothetical protein